MGMLSGIPKKHPLFYLCSSPPKSFFRIHLNQHDNYMKNKALHLALLLLLALLSCCSGDDKVAPSITISTPESDLTLESKVNSSLNVQFSTTYDWQAKTDAAWAVISPNKGTAGENEINILANEDNRTGEVRTATLTITSEGISKTVTFKQDETQVLNLKQNSYEVAAKGEDIKIEFASNVENCQFKLTSTGEFPQWISIREDETGTRALKDGALTITVENNRNLKSRKAQLQIVATAIDNPDNVLLKSSVISIQQAAAEVGTSTNYSEYDKKVITVQRHSVGNGVPLVFMGDGFIDKDIEEGYYLKAMEKGIEHFFSEEPVKSLREYFDVWIVTAVSQNNAFGGAYSTRFACTLAGGGSSGISGNHNTVMEYTKLVPELGNNPELFNETLATVILNTEAYAGTTFFGFSFPAYGTTEFAIGYCPIIYGLDNEMFRRVLCHECIGHGFTKLLDEYSYEQMGTMPTDQIEKDRRMQQELGWAMNVDFTNDRNNVLWNHFLKDKRYQGEDAFGETLGIYEGACTYWRGAWRPTYESMMRSNIHGFNAPSREAIYKRIMKLAYGDSWVYNLEEFIEFDQKHLPVPTKATTRMPEKPMPPFATPVFVGKEF